MIAPGHTDDKMINREEILTVSENNFADLHRSKVHPNTEQKRVQRKKIQNIDSEEFLDITVEEIDLALTV